MTLDKREYWTDQLTTARHELESLLMTLTEEQLHAPVISEGQSWNALDVVAHLLENERAMSIHVHKIRQGRETVPEGFDLDQWNAGLKDRTGSSSLEALLDGLSQTRAKTLEVMGSLSDEDWDLRGRHPRRGIITIEQYYETIAEHDMWHTKDIRQGLGLSN